MSNFLWKLINTDKLNWNKENTDEHTARRFLQKLWVAGTLGAFFAAFARNIPNHIAEFSISLSLGSFEYTIGVFLKYSYLLWLLVYFFISNLNNELQGEDYRPTNNDLFYDIIQSGLALGSAFFLGFVPSNILIECSPFYFVNFTIAIICALALHWFGTKQKQGIKNIRLWGVGVSFISIIFIYVFSETIILLIFLSFFQLFTWWLLLAFLRIRLFSKTIASS